MRVTSPSPVALFTVTYSRKVLLSPISVRVIPLVHFRSWVLRPMLAKGKISFCCPSVVKPSMTTWEWRRQPSPSVTCSPMIQYGPISQEAWIRAFGWTTAVSWIESMPCLLVNDDEGHVGLTDDLAIDLAHAFCPANLATVTGELNLDEQGVTRK